jgi:hypothetical protein
MQSTRWFKYDRDDLCVNKSQFFPVIFEPPCIRLFVGAVFRCTVYKERIKKLRKIRSLSSGFV